MHAWADQKETHNSPHRVARTRNNQTILTRTAVTKLFLTKSLFERQAEADPSCVRNSSRPQTEYCLQPALFSFLSEDRALFLRVRDCDHGKHSSTAWPDRQTD